LSLDADGKLLMTIRTETELHDECGGGEFYVAVSRCVHWWIIDLNFSRIQTSTLMKFLYEKASERGAEIRFGTQVAEVSSQDVLITLASGKKLVADVVVGADGPSSVVRKGITGDGSSDKTRNVNCVGEYLSWAPITLEISPTDKFLKFPVRKEDYSRTYKFRWTN
jgi:flavin-dependent dehydrogenase